MAGGRPTDETDKPEALPLTNVSGSSFGPTIKAQLDEERARKASLESRGIGIVTSSGALATLLFGLVTFTRGNVNAAHGDIDDFAVGALVLGVGLFAVAAILGLVANLPMKYKEAAVDRLESRVTPDEWFRAKPVEAARRDAKLNVDVLKSARRVNARKASAVAIGVGAEAAAAVAIALAVAVELWRWPA